MNYTQALPGFFHICIWRGDWESVYLKRWLVKCVFEEVTGKVCIWRGDWESVYLKRWLGKCVLEEVTGKVFYLLPYSIALRRLSLLRQIINCTSQWILSFLNPNSTIMFQTFSFLLSKSTPFVCLPYQLYNKKHI